ncbi:hypothetical protein [Glutamicibacter sp. NPDC087344]|uniref:hypothetical protein n=1 Tax=Glutamicibacter sp. NPDC087344 TaxID=3363994 RepID=UPI0037FAC25B
MKKFVFPLAAGVLILSACTTPVSKLEMVDPQGNGSPATAWDSEQQSYDETFADPDDPYAQYYQDGVPFFSELQSQVVNTAAVFGPLEARENSENLVMGMSGFFRSTVFTDETGAQEVVNDSMSIGGTVDAPGTYQMEFGCWGTGQATARVIMYGEQAELNLDLDLDSEPSKMISLACNVPAAVATDEFEFTGNELFYDVVISGEPKTVGSYELNLFQTSGGQE